MEAGMTIFEAFRRAMRGLAIAAALGVFAFAFFLGYCAYTLPLSQNQVEAAPANTMYLASGGEAFAARGVYRGDKVAADQSADESGASRRRDRGPALLQPSRDRSARHRARGLAQSVRGAASRAPARSPSSWRG